MKTSNTARIFLALNATFSLIIGIDLLLATGTASEILFAEQADWQPITLRVLGVGLLIFALELYVMASNRFLTRKQVMVITVMDIGWVVGSALLLLMASSVFTESGDNLIVVVAVAVAVFAAGQYIGALKIVMPKSRAEVQFRDRKLIATVKREVDAPVAKVWSVMTDHPGYADVANNLSKVEVLSGEGLGMVRQCYGPKGESWRETCDLYEEGKLFGFNVHTEADGYPYPMSDLRGRWSVDKKGSGAAFTIDIEAKPKGNLIARMLFVVAAKRQFKGVLVDLADAWARKMEREAGIDDLTSERTIHQGMKHHKESNISDTQGGQLQ